MTKRFFVAGTDTEVGKTLVSLQLLKYLKSQSLQTVAIKPVASGLSPSHKGLVNDDALKLRVAATCELPYAEVNPVLLTKPIAPHIAAAQQGMTLRAEVIANKCLATLQHPHDVAVIEGCGGWLCPLSTTEMMEDLVVRLDCEVILVVGVRLGCLNAGLLTVKAIEQSGVKFAGWVANCIDLHMLAVEENIASLQSMISAPMLGVIDYGSSIKLKTDIFDRQAAAVA